MIGGWGSEEVHESGARCCVGMSCMYLYVVYIDPEYRGSRSTDLINSLSCLLGCLPREQTRCRVKIIKSALNSLLPPKAELSIGEAWGLVNKLSTHSSITKYSPTGKNTSPWTKSNLIYLTQVEKLGRSELREGLVLKGKQALWGQLAIWDRKCSG